MNLSVSEEWREYLAVKEKKEDLDFGPKSGATASDLTKFLREQGQATRFPFFLNCRRAPLDPKGLRQRYKTTEVLDALEGEHHTGAGTRRSQRG